MSERKFTLKQDGKYFSRNGARQGFIAPGIAGCYSYNLANVKAVQRIVGGKIVEVVHMGGWHYEERELCES